MKDTLKEILLKLGLPILASIIVGIGSAIITGFTMTQLLENRVTNLEGLKPKIESLEKMETRITPLEIQIVKHEKALERDFARHEQRVFDLTHKTEDQEKRLTRLETLVNKTQRLLTEIRADVKILLRGGQQ